MDNDITMQEVVECLNITRVTGSQPAGNDGRGLIHASLSPHSGDRRVEHRLILPAHRLPVRSSASPKRGEMSHVVHPRGSLMSGRFVDYQVSRISGRVQSVMRSARATAS